jgi:hypothetical protein
MPIKNGFILLTLKIKIILLLVLYWKDIIIYNSENYEFILTIRDAYNNNVIGVIEHKMEIIITVGMMD